MSGQDFHSWVEQGRAGQSYAEQGRFLCLKLTVVRNLTETLIVYLRKSGSGDGVGIRPLDLTCLFSWPVSKPWGLLLPNPMEASLTEAAGTKRSRCSAVDRCEAQPARAKPRQFTPHCAPRMSSLSQTYVGLVGMCNPCCAHGLSGTSQRLSA